MTALFVGLFASAARAAVVEDETVPIVDSPQVVPCSGDLLVFNGDLRIQVTTTVNANRVSGTTLLQPRGVTGTDSDGRVYHGVGNFTSSVAGSVTNGSFTGTEVNNFFLVGTAGAPTLKEHETLHITVDKAGNAVVLVDNFFVTCG